MKEIICDAADECNYGVCEHLQSHEEMQDDCKPCQKKWCCIVNKKVECVEVPRDYLS